MFKQNKTILIIAAIIIIAAGLVYALKGDKIFDGNGGQDNNGKGNEEGLRPIDSTDHVFGSLKAPVQMIVYSDFECPFCAEFAATMKQVEKEFADKVVVAFRHYLLPGHPEAEPAAQASECAAEQGKFWQMHDKLFADNLSGLLRVEQSKQNAADLGLDAAQFNQCLDSGKYQTKVAEIMAGGKRAGVTGTPTSFINGDIYIGAYPFEDFTSSDGRQELGMKSIISALLK